MGDKLVLLRNGKVQQVGSPGEVYNRPVNRFVATFLGSPTMNFITGGSVKQENDTIFYEDAGIRVALPEGLRLSLLQRSDWQNIKDDLTLGIRPEAIYFTKTANSISTDTQSRVDLVQSLGAETIVSLSMGSHLLQALTDPSLRLRPTDQVPIYLDMQKVYLFIESTGETLLPIEMHDGFHELEE
jgi:multiple sugar transport system ATP-binding protein